nr:hypothetical protein [Tanacetum cinerariifolium]
MGDWQATVDDTCYFQRMLVEKQTTYMCNFEHVTEGRLWFVLRSSFSSRLPMEGKIEGSTNGLLLEFSEAAPPRCYLFPLLLSFYTLVYYFGKGIHNESRWVNHGKPPDIDVAGIADAASIR